MHSEQVDMFFFLIDTYRNWYKVAWNVVFHATFFCVCLI